MGPFWSKFDAGLATVYANYLEIERQGRANVPWIHRGLRRKVTGAHVRLRFEGPLSDIERAGFETNWVRSDNRVASGIVRFATLEAVASVPGVIQLSYGTEDELDLDRSVPFVHADELREYSTAAHLFTGITGRNVIVAILDSGLDYTHDFLQEPTDSDDELRETRILRIWDQGLVPVSGEHGPDSALLGGRPTYGVEYTEDDINAVINDDPEATVTVRHRDCVGHGTHVASIAAGTGGRAREYVGMAPRAMLIGVKVLHLENEPRNGSAVIGFRQRFADAIDYVYGVAATAELGGRRVVMNYSASTGLGPHDGLSEAEEDLIHQLTSDPRRVLVATAGNQGTRGRQSRATIPAGQSSIAIPCLLTDDRQASGMTDYNACRVEPSGDDVSMDIWYRAPPPTAVGGTLQIEGVSGTISIPALAGTPSQATFGSGQTYRITHKNHVADVDGRQIQRNVIHLTVTPSNNRYQSGQTRAYTFVLTGTAGQVFEVFGGGSAHWSVKFDTDGDDARAADFGDTSEIGAPGSASAVIAVGNFEIPDEDGATEGTSSSHGPLVSYDDAWTPPPKPDLAAPGEHIRAARSRFSTRPAFCTTLPRHDSTIAMSGTSMAAPHVTGLVALMLEKNPTLTLTEIRSHFRFLTGHPADANLLGAGIIDAQATLAAVDAP